MESWKKKTERMKAGDREEEQKRWRQGGKI